MNFVDENKIYYKDIDELYPNPHNEKFYNKITKENIQDLKQSILTLGGITNPLLLQNIVMENYILYQETGEEKQLNNYLKKV